MEVVWPRLHLEVQQGWWGTGFGLFSLHNATVVFDDGHVRAVEDGLVDRVSMALEIVMNAHFGLRF